MKNHLFCCLFFVVFVAFSQIDLFKRLELDSKLDNFEYQIISAQEHGFLVYSMTKKKEEHIDVEELKNQAKNKKEEVEEPTQKIWEFIKYDKNFVEEKRIQFVVSVDLFYSTVFQDEHKIYFFYQNPLSKERNDFLVLTIDIQTLVYRTFEGHLPPATSITHFHVTQDRVFVAGWTNQKPMMTLIDLKNADVKDILLPKDFSVHSFSQAHDGDIFVILRSIYDKKELEIEYCFWEYSKYGYQESDVLLFSKEEGFYIENIQIVHQKEKGRYFVFGGYIHDKRHHLKGVYSLMIDDKSKERAQYYQYDFYDFKHFFDPLKIAETNPKIPFLYKQSTKREKIDYLFTFHEIEEVNNGYLLIGEVYFPHFQKNSKVPFKGNLYTHAVMIYFDKDGYFTWDNLFEMDIQTPTMNQTTFLKTNPNGVELDVLCYDAGVFKGGFFYNGNKVMEFVHVLGTGKEYEKILVHHEQKMIHWYGNYYLLSGRQRILDTNTQQERSIFFIDCVERK